MIIDNIRIINKDRLPVGIIPTGPKHTPESYYYMMEKRDPDPCLIVDVTVHYGDKDPLAADRLIREYMEKNNPDVDYFFERSMAAFNQFLNDLNQRDENSLIKKNEGKSFIYFYIYLQDREVASKLAKYVKSKPFQTKVLDLQKAA